jgi:hypothetical protein
LTKYFQARLNKPNIKVAFFGSHLQNDIQATYDFDQKLRTNKVEARWDVIAVIEELWHLDNALDYGQNPQLIPNDEKFFG